MANQNSAHIRHTNVNCREGTYPRSTVERFPLREDQVPWEKDLPEYKPKWCLTDSAKDKPWSDKTDCKKKLNWNAAGDKDATDLTKVDRQSHIKKYDLYQVQTPEGEDIGSCPKNPIGRTGIIGRGCLGRWGPNHAADPIVTRWSKDGAAVNGKKYLEFIAVQRRDNKEWAIPGGMVDWNEKVSETLRREFGEEALNSLEASDRKKEKIRKRVDRLFKAGEQIYAGYVDDPRNTDNAWMETVVYNFHDEEGKGVARFKLAAGDDAVGVRWMRVDSKLKLYASHREFLRLVAEKRGAQWDA